MKKALFVVLILLVGCFCVKSVTAATFRFVLTQGMHQETENLDAIVKQEFGQSAAVADWQTIKSLHSNDISTFCDTVGLLAVGNNAWVYNNGQAWWSGNRHYFVERHEHNVPYNWLVHDQIDNNFLDLGSWYGLSMPILVDLGSCDFSSSPDINIQRCFGGIGNQCEGDAPFLPFEYHENICYVDGYMSVGSILHDRCCLKNNNNGYMCDGIMSLRKLPCYSEFYWATEDTTCGRFWATTFGPYPVGNLGDETTVELRAPSGARVHPDQSNYCQSGGCQLNSRNKPIILGKGLCKYCICR